MYTGLHVQYSLLLCNIDETFAFRGRFSNSSKYEISSSDCQFGATGKTNRQTHITKLKVAFQQNLPKRLTTKPSFTMAGHCTQNIQTLRHQRHPLSHRSTVQFEMHPVPLKVRSTFKTLSGRILGSSSTLTHCRRVTQICVFNTVKLGTSACSP